ncbi:MAG: FAD-dependent oxidoreductase [Gammaproteobacteria bacterium]|nr:FAD-dependent oxidoreductase [Gammaproteobacteria bacterium]
MQIVVIGGVAAGMSAASQAKRRMPEAEVIALERGQYVSYGACGMPYNIEDPQRDIEDLVVITPAEFRHARGIDVRIGHEVRMINSASKELAVHDHAGGRDYVQAYDRLVIATGAEAVRPPISGLELPGVFVLRELTDGAAIKRFLEETAPRRATIIGAGFIGMEMADVLAQRGLSVQVLERTGQVIPGFEPVIAEIVAGELHRHGLRIDTGVTVHAIEARDQGLNVRTDHGEAATDLVIVAAGVRPRVDLARAAGVKLGATGAIAVDAMQRTSIPDIFAAGDCAEAFHEVLGQPVYIPLGTTANKQGKVAGANAAGAQQRFAGIVGTAGFKVFDIEVARAGVGGAEISRYGLDALSCVSRHSSRGHHYPGSVPITTVLFVERGSGRLLGAQMAGGDTVAKRIDVFATALHARMRVDEVESLDLSYAPPFAPVYDPVIIAAAVARKISGGAGK